MNATTSTPSPPPAVTRPPPRPRRRPQPSAADLGTPVTTFRAAARRAVRNPPTSYRRRDRPPLLLVTVTVEGLGEPVDAPRLAAVREAMGHVVPAGYAVDVPAVVRPPTATLNTGGPAASSPTRIPTQNAGPAGREQNP